jgi:hypothetical protein
MPNGRYVTQNEWTNTNAHANRANAAVNNVDAGSARLNNFNNTGAAQNANEQVGEMVHANNNWEYQRGDEERQAQNGFERSLQDRAMSDREHQTAVSDRANAMKYGSMNVQSNALASGMQSMGSSPLTGLTASTPTPGVDIYNNGGQRIGGSGYRSVLSGLG